MSYASNARHGLRAFAAGLVLAALLTAASLALMSGPAAARGFHRCGSQKLENHGIFKLRAKHAKCRLARQVAYARLHGDTTPKGFVCTTWPGGNLTPFNCKRGIKVVRFSLEG